MISQIYPGFTIPGIANPVRVEYFTSLTNWTQPPTDAVEFYLFEACGAGGGGRGGGGTNGGITQNGGQGGNSGAYFAGYAAPKDLPDSLLLTPGAPGIGGAGNNTSGAAGSKGGDTTVGALLTVIGGNGGLNGTPAPAPSSFAPFVSVAALAGVISTSNTSTNGVASAGGRGKDTTLGGENGGSVSRNSVLLLPASVAGTDSATVPTVGEDGRVGAGPFITDNAMRAATKILQRFGSAGSGGAGGGQCTTTAARGAKGGRGRQGGGGGGGGATASNTLAGGDGGDGGEGFIRIFTVFKKGYQNG